MEQALFIPAEQMNVVTLALMYYGAKQTEKIPALLKERELHPYVKDVIRAIAGKTVMDDGAYRTARELIWWNFESKTCPMCRGERVVGYAYNWNDCPKCRGRGKVDK